MGLEGRTTIDVDEAQDIADGYDGDMGAKLLSIQDLSEHRWYTKQLVAFEIDDDLLGFIYLKPKSELQEDQDRFESVPVPLFPVWAKTVTTTVYERVTS